MAGKMITEGGGPPTLVTSREPISHKRAGDKGSTGDQALMDALIMVGIAWALLFGLAFSLRSHNI